MSSHINVLLKHAANTFSNFRDRFPQNVNILKQLIDKTTAEDVGIKNHKLLHADTWLEDKAPVTYVDIYGDDRISVGIFILKPGMKLPLHDHPKMYGFIKAIHGTLNITSFTIQRVDGLDVVALKHKAVYVTESDNCCTLEPIRGNLHEIESVNGVAAFLDVLAPPYESSLPEYGTRPCTYYTLGSNALHKTNSDQSSSKDDSEMYRLCAVKSPSWFWTDCYPYLGPSIDFFNDT